MPRVSEFELNFSQLYLVMLKAILLDVREVEGVERIRFLKWVLFIGVLSCFVLLLGLGGCVEVIGVWFSVLKLSGLD